jgi:hypothetical protein
MRPFLRCAILFLAVARLWACPGQARAEAPPKLVKETWDTAYVEGARCGYFHTAVHEVERDGKKCYRTSQEMSLLVKRYQEVVRLRIESSVDETAEGKVVALTLTQFTDQGKFTVTGTVEKDKLVLKPEGDPNGKTLAWDDKAVGPYKQDRLLADRKAKAGDKVEFLSFEPSLFTAVTVRAAVKPAEEVDLLEEFKEGDGVKVRRVTKSLLRVEAQPDQIMVEGKPVKLPRLVTWLEKDYAVARSETEFPGLGKMTLYRTTAAVAKQDGLAPALLPDLGLNTLISVDKALDGVHAKSEAVYRITIQGDDDPATAFARDARQEVKNVKDKTFELHVKAQRRPAAVENPGKADEEFLKGSYFIDGDDAKVKELTAKAVGDEKDAWQRALRIEKWVNKNMTGTSGVAFATASQVAKDLKGDCRQHAMLMTAMCRAAGVPARTAVGLVYVRDPDKGPALGFHMWTEVWVQGQWLGLDATLGEGGVGPGHLKIADHSWNNTQTLAPVLPVLRVMGKTKVEVLSVK